eukprot:scaffold79236_cov32-Tisochrysis_lutea.AAC.2
MPVWRCERRLRSIAVTSRAALGAGGPVIAQCAALAWKLFFFHISITLVHAAERRDRDCQSRVAFPKQGVGIVTNVRAGIGHANSDMIRTCACRRSPTTFGRLRTPFAVGVHCWDVEVGLGQRSAVRRGEGCVKCGGLDGSVLQLVVSVP